MSKSLHKTEERLKDVKKIRDELETAIDSLRDDLSKTEQKKKDLQHKVRSLEVKVTTQPCRSQFLSTACSPLDICHQGEAGLGYHHCHPHPFYLLLLFCILQPPFVSFLWGYFRAGRYLTILCEIYFVKMSRNSSV